MTPAEIRDAMTRLYGPGRDASARLAADLLAHPRSVTDWLSGRYKIPGPAEAAISLMLDMGRPPRSPMTPGELHEAISELFDDPLVSQRRYRLARAINVSPHTLNSWLYGARPISGTAEVAIRLMLKRKYFLVPSSSMDNAEFYARLANHEFLLEVVYANMLASRADPYSAADKMGDDLLERVRFRGYVSSTPEILESEDILAVQTLSIEMMEGFVKKVKNRLNDILKELGEAQGEDG